MDERRELAWMLFGLEFLVVYAILSRIIRSVWFRQLGVSATPLLLVAGMVHRYHIPWTIHHSQWNPPDPEVWGAVYWSLVGLAGGCAFRSTQAVLSVPMLVFANAVLVQLYWLVEHGEDTGCDSKWFVVLAGVLYAWCTREFVHCTTLGAILIAIPAVLAGGSAYYVSGLQESHRPLIWSIQSLRGVVWPSHSNPLNETEAGEYGNDG